MTTTTCVISRRKSVAMGALSALGFVAEWDTKRVDQLAQHDVGRDGPRELDDLGLGIVPPEVVPDGIRNRLVVAVEGLGEAQRRLLAGRKVGRLELVDLRQ